MEIYENFIQMTTVIKLTNVVITFFIAWIFHRLSWRVAGLILRLSGFTLPPGLSTRHRFHFFGRFARTTAKVSGQWSKFNQWLPTELKTAHQVQEKRQKTLQELIANAVSLLAFIIAILVSLSQFAHQDTVVWVAGLFGSALAFAGRTFIGDFLAGISIIFQDQFDVGEKILIKSQMEIIEGVVEHVSLNATWLRARTGELYIISNGEMRFICNFSRGLHSSANITINIAATDLEKTLLLLQELGQEAVELLPELREPWKIISKTGALGQNVELTLVGKAHFGHAADLRPQLLALVQKRLTQADITLAG